ncbi:hypothetical protein Z043_125551, partial [Scleropages formosus]
KTMENISAVTSFKLIEYMEMEDQKYLYFIVFLLLYILTLCTNLLLISVIYFEKSLHEPMYIFVGNLAVNGIYRSTILNPFLLKSPEQTPSHFFQVQTVFHVHLGEDMQNISAVTSFILVAYTEMEKLKYLYFTVFLLLYLLILCLNLLVIGVIYSQKSLHDPMYIFVSNLV